MLQEMAHYTFAINNDRMHTYSVGGGVGWLRGGGLVYFAFKHSAYSGLALVWRWCSSYICDVVEWVIGRRDNFIIVTHESEVLQRIDSDGNWWFYNFRRINGQKQFDPKQTMKLTVLEISYLFLFDSWLH